MRTGKDNSKIKTVNKKLIAASDYYIEDGNLVFTAAYHIKRGYCCQQGCRHCPYGSKENYKLSHR
jgi:hypothetical protein